VTLYDQTVHKTLNERAIVVIGDVHGRLDLLTNLLEEVAGFGAQVVLLGDYIDRGTDGVGVLRFVRELVNNPSDLGFSKATALMGNHEHMAVIAAETGRTEDVSLWVQNGGRMEEFPAIKHEFKNWLHYLPVYYEHPKPIYFEGELKNLVCTHASVDPSRSLKHQNLDTLIWDRTVRGYDKNTVLVNGHTPHKRPQFFETMSGTVLQVDTGAYRTGELSALVFEEVW